MPTFFTLIFSLEKVAAGREKRREKNEERKGQKEKATLCATFSFWWGMVDLPHPGHKLRLHRTTQ